MNEKEIKKLSEELFYKSESAWEKTDKDEVFKFCEGYKQFLKFSKTERECAKNIVKTLSGKGFKSIDDIKMLSPGAKVYKLYKHRVVLAAVIGREPGVLRIIGSHIDSPRIDLKPNPMYEDAAVVLLKSHYYGGIKKYHWVNIPLSFFGVVHTKKGKIEIVYGEEANEPKFIIPDLLPHLAKEQMAKKMRDGISGEQLNILVGNIPVKSKKIKEKVKLNILKILHEKYGIKEKDFLTADIEFTPAFDPVDIGFDAAMIAAYGQDDRSCVYTSLTALEETVSPRSTAVGFFVDKEETDSDGNTGATSTVLENFIKQLMRLSAVKTPVEEVLENAYSLSGDVTAAFNPNFPDPSDKTNASFLGHGVSVEKYGGGGGKYSTNDASSEFMSWLIGILEKDNVCWQTGELGKIDKGGGGTIAKYMSILGMECIDVGPSLLSMHSNAELSSKVDIYHTYKAYKAFLKS